MCAVSNINDHYRDLYPITPSPWKNYPFPSTPVENTIIKEVPREPTAKEIEDWIQKNKKWTIEKYEVFKKLLEEARKLDALMGEADCEDPEKTKWIQDLEELVKHLKARQNKKVKRKR